MQSFIEEKREAIVELCRTHYVRRFSVFGSAVRDDFDPERSDVDVRVEFDEAGAFEHGYAENYFDLQDKLIHLFGRKVDVVSGLIRNSYFREEIEKSQVTLYAAQPR